VDDLDRLRAGVPVLETTGGHAGWSMSARQLEGYRSLAKWAGVPLELVARYMSNGTASALIETRARSRRRPLDPRKPGMGARSPWDCYTVLAHKRYPVL
jgi:hypothetical protein